MTDGNVDPLGVSAGIRKCESLPAWSESLAKPQTTSVQDPLSSGNSSGDTPAPNRDVAAGATTADDPAVDEPARSLFPYDPYINNVVALWDGDITKIQCDAIVNTTNESLNDFCQESVTILAAGGPALQTACKAAGSCRTGEVRVTEGYELPTRCVRVCARLDVCARPVGAYICVMMSLYFCAL